VKVLLSGNFQPGQLAWLCERGLLQLGVEVIPLDATRDPLEGYRGSAWPAFSIFANFWHQRWINRQLKTLSLNTCPDIILILKGEDIEARSLAWVRQKLPQTRLANWNPDSPLNPLNTTVELLKGLPLYDECFIWGKFLLEPLQKLGAQKVTYLPFAYDAGLHRRVEMTAGELSEWGNDLSFIGTWEADRETTLNHLADMNLGIWGNLWQRLPPQSPLRKRWRGEAHGEKLAKVNSASQIALNFIRKQNGSAHNMRTFEAPACGVMMLTTRTTEQVELFGEDEGAAFFGEPEELRAKADFYLAHPNKREAVAREGLRRIQTGHTYTDRMRVIVEHAGS
jgi:spore maturation protein CgeB